MRSRRRESIDFYSENQAATSDPAGQGMFASLVKEEEEHMMLLERQLDWLRKNRTYFRIRRFLGV